MARTWRTTADEQGVALVLDEASAADPLLRLTCGRDSTLGALSTQLEFIESEERMSVGASSAVVALPATAIPGQAGVQASGALESEFLDALATGGPVAVSYGAQTLGPFDATLDAEVARFVEACREYLDAAPS